jgi:hypothetical protein
VIPNVPPSTSSCLISVQYSVVMHVITAFGSRLQVALPVNIGRMVNSAVIMGLPPHTDGDLHIPNLLINILRIMNSEASWDFLLKVMETKIWK